MIDSFGKSRNAWYALHQKEDTETHMWVMQEHLKAAEQPPEVFGSDRHASLIAAAALTMPTALHIYCLHHLNGNVAQKVRVILGADWKPFQRDFWAAYHAVSPDEFDRLWKHLTVSYPAAQQYLDEELYSCRQRWAWAWIGSVFTAGTRTTGRVESENRVNKVIGGPKKTLLQLFNGLNDRTNDQTELDLIRQRQVSLRYISNILCVLICAEQVSRRHHVANLENLFLPIIDLLRKFAGPYANEKSRREMGESMFYTAEVVQLPSGSRDWVCLHLVMSCEFLTQFQETYSFQVETEVGFTSDHSVSVSGRLRIILNQYFVVYDQRFRR